MQIIHVFILLRNYPQNKICVIPRDYPKHTTIILLNFNVFSKSEYKFRCAHIGAAAMIYVK